MSEKEHNHDLNVKSVDRLSSTRVRLTVEFSGDTMQKHEKMMVNRYMQVAKIPGFRPGKAPVSMVKQKFKDEIRRDIISHLLEAGLSEALQKTNLSPVSRPKIQLNEVAEGQPFVFQAEFDVEPEINLKNYKGIPLKKQNTEPSEEEITNTLNNLRDRMAALEPHEGEKAEKGGFAVVEVGYELVDDPAKKDEPKNYTVEVGNDKLLPAIDKVLLEMKVGETQKVQETFPEEYGDKTVAGKKANFEVKLLELKKKVLPELNDSFASQLKEGATLESIKTEITESIKQSKLEEVTKAQRQEIVDHLIQANKFDVPVSLVEEQMASLMQWMTEDFKKRGIKMPQPKPEELNSIRQRAENMVKSSLLLKEIAIKESIKLDEQRLQARVDVIATQLERSVDDTKKFLEGKGMFQRLRDEILTDQLFEFLILNAKVS